jgi:tetratricopeptide (TPR) repeat protein
VAARHERLGDILAKEEESIGAKEHYEQVIGIYRRLVKQDEDETNAKRHYMDLVSAQITLGEWYKWAGDISKAHELFDEAFGIAERFSKLDPNDSEWQRQVLRCQLQIADLRLSKNLVEALQEQLATAHELLNIATNRTLQDPDNALSQRQLAHLHNTIGRSLAGLAQQGIAPAENYAKALESYKVALPIVHPLEKRDPANLGFKDILADGQLGIARVLEAQGRTAEALTVRIKHWRDHLDLTQREIRGGPANTALA